MDLVTSAGAVGAAQNMIGEAVHSVVENSKIAAVLKAVGKVFPSANLFHCKLDDRGVHLI
jgi:hypothetical protein